MPTRIPPNGDAPQRKKKFFVVVALVAGLLFAIGIEKNMPTANNPKGYNYNPLRVSEDAWEHEHEVDSSNFTGECFDVTPREGCWGGYITLPNAWRAGWRFEVIGNDSTAWNAFWFRGRKPEGPFGRDDDAEFLYYPMKFRLQGKGAIRFYRP